ncbi:ATP-binding protein [Weissella hellenica]|nr:ATP-binding protein [Weissella hellenica]
MIEKWPIGVITLVSDGIIEYTAKHSDLETRINHGHVQEIKGISDFVYADISVTSLLLMRVFKVRTANNSEDERESSFILSDKVIFSAEPIGVLGPNGFIPGAGRFPLVGENVFAADDAVVEHVFSNIGDHLISLGTVNNYDNVHPDLNLKKILTSHIAILGNTGSGKSTTLRTLIQQISKVQDELNPLVKFFVFDVHGDYGELNFATHIDVSKKHLPLSKLSLEDWAAALLPSERTQKPLLARAINIAKVISKNSEVIYALLARDALENTTQDSFASLKRLVKKWFDKAFKEDEEALSCLNNWTLDFGKEIDGDSVYQKLIGKINDSHFDDIDEIIHFEEAQTEFNLVNLEDAFEVVFGEEEVKGNKRIRSNSETFMSRFRNLKTKYGNSDGFLNVNHGEELTLKIPSDAISDRKSKIFILNLVGLDDDALRIISTYLARQVFDFNKHKFQEKEEKSSMPFDYLYLDEAHRYVRNSDTDTSSIFETIAREGRKFSVYLGVVSQIPNELSKVVMSQVGAFFIHRIQNSIDLDYIRRNVPAATNGMVGRLSSLPAGTALLSGTAFEVPFELNVKAGKMADGSESRNPLRNSI